MSSIADQIAVYRTLKGRPVRRQSHAVHSKKSRLVLLKTRLLNWRHADNRRVQQPATS